LARVRQSHGSYFPCVMTPPAQRFRILATMSRVPNEIMVFTICAVSRYVLIGCYPIRYAWLFLREARNIKYLI
jgi:hypothetical protein